MSATSARRMGAVLPLGGALLAAVFIYFPALNSPFHSDDYLLLLASRDMPWSDFLRSSFDPGADPGALRLSANYWRPLSFVTFRLIYVVFGDEPLPYHLFNLAVHLASVMLVYALGWRLTKSRLGAAVAALVMAVHPEGFESITWIASLNSAALPLALAGWLAFTRAIDAESTAARNRWLAASLGLAVVALAYRESVAGIVVAMLLWYGMVERRERLRERETQILAGVHIALLVVYLLLTGILDPDGGRPLIDADQDVFKNWWFYAERGLVPLGSPEPAWQDSAQFIGTVVLIGVAVIAALRRQWLVLALSLGFFVSLVPYAAFSLGRGERYFYIPGALLALLLGAAATVCVASLAKLKTSAPIEQICVLGIAAVAAVTAVTANHRVAGWVETHPEVNQAWVDQLLATYPELPEGGGLFVSKTPPTLNVLDAYILQPMVNYLYEGENHPVYWIQDQYIDYGRSVMKPDDRWFTFEPE